MLGPLGWTLGKIARAFWDEDPQAASQVVHGAADYTAAHAGFAVAGPLGALLAPLIVEPTALWVGNKLGYTGDIHSKTRTDIGWSESDQKNYQLMSGSISIQEYYKWKLDFEQRRRNWLTVGSANNRGFGSHRVVVNRSYIDRISLPKCKDGFHLKNGVCVKDDFLPF